MGIVDDGFYVCFFFCTARYTTLAKDSRHTACLSGANIG